MTSSWKFPKMSLFSDENIELLRNVPVHYWLFLTVLCVSTHIGGVYGVQDFTVYRMQHFDLHGAHLGSRSALVNMEARGMAAKMLNRKCVFVKWAELSPDLFQDLLNRGSGSLLVLLPQEWAEQNNETIASWIELESHLLSLEIPIPIYFTHETSELLEIYESLQSSADSDGSGTATSALISSVVGEGYFVIADAPEATVLTENAEIVSMAGKLIGAGYDQEQPTVAIVTHYDSFGLVPSLSMSGDSGGSGVAAILELARIFSILYSNSQHKPRYNLLFVVAGGGNLNYFGTKYFIEDMIEDSDSYLLTEADYTLCLDALAGGDKLFLHMSKPPKLGTKAHEILEHLNKSTELLQGLPLAPNHKKIRIGEELLAWEHERFSLRRIPALTLSHFKDHAHPRRKSVFHTEADIDVLYKNVQVIAEAVGRHILGLKDMDNYSIPLFTGSLKVSKKYLQAWLDQLSGIPRSPQLFSKDHRLLTSIEQTLSQYVDEVLSFSHKPDKSDPEFALYSQHSTTVHAYSVKPAIFDLFLALGIVGYVGLIYLVIRYFKIIQDIVAQMKLKGE